MRRFSAVAAAVLLLGIGAAISGKTPEVPVFVPGEQDGGNAVLEGATWTEEGPDFAIRLQQLDNAQRMAYIEHTTGLAIDPFASPPDKIAGFMSFVLQIENRGEGTISFNPETCWLVTDRKKDLQAPFSLHDLKFAYSVSGRDLPQAYRRAGPALLERAESIGPGQSISGLLIYKALHPKTRRLHVDAVLSLPSGDIVRFSAPYRRATGKS